MTHDGDVKLGDFGISKQLNGENIMRYSIYMNYYIYKAPELQKSETYTKKSDIWALGCIIYELFTINVYDGNNFSIENDPPCDCMPFTLSRGWRSHLMSMLSPYPDEKPSIDEVLNYLELLEHKYFLGPLKFGPYSDENYELLKKK